jgi:hypothetical protein
MADEPRLVHSRRGPPPYAAPLLEQWRQRLASLSVYCKQSNSCHLQYENIDIGHLCTLSRFQETLKAVTLPHPEKPFSKRSRHFNHHQPRCSLSHRLKRCFFLPRHRYSLTKTAYSIASCIHCRHHNHCSYLGVPETKRPRNTLPVSPAVTGKISCRTHFHHSRSVAPLGLSVPSVRELEPGAVSARGECDSSSRITPTICNRHIQRIAESFHL